jgi:hypothetical protein
MKNHGYDQAEWAGRLPAERSLQAAGRTISMKGYILRDKEVEDEAKKARKAMDSGALGTSGVWRTQVDQAKVYSRASRLSGSFCFSDVQRRRNLFLPRAEV